MRSLSNFSVFRLTAGPLMTTLLLCGTAVGEEVKIKFTSEQLEKMPMWASLAVSEIDQEPIRVNIGKNFIGQAIVGRVRLTNGSELAVPLGIADASCGCTALQSAGKQIAPSQFEDLVFGVMLSEPGPFQSEVTLPVGAAIARFELIGDGARRVQPQSSSVGVEESGQCEVAFIVHDPVIELESLEFACRELTVASVEKSPSGVGDTSWPMAIRVRLSGERERLIDSASVSVTHDKTPLGVFQFDLRHPGRIQVVNQVCHTPADASSIRLFLKGDIESVVAQDKWIAQVEPEIGEVELPIKNAKLSGGFAVVDVLLPPILKTAGSYRIHLGNSKNRHSFFLVVRE